jgi:hypothetical protein
MNQWLIFLVVAVLYVHLFNAIAGAYFESGQTMTWTDLYRRFVPPTEFRVTL